MEPQGAVRTRTGTTPSSGGLITATASTMGVDVGHKRVRAVGGGHSARHAERHEAAGYRTSYAPVWTDSAARAVLEQLKADMAAWHTKKVGDYCLKVLSRVRELRRALRQKKMRVWASRFSRTMGMCGASERASDVSVAGRGSECDESY